MPRAAPRLLELNGAAVGPSGRLGARSDGFSLWSMCAGMPKENPALSWAKPLAGLVRWRLTSVGRRLA